MVFCLLGPPGSGKDTQSRVLKDKFGISIVSPGEVLRAAVASQHILASQISPYMNKGKLVPDHIVDEALRDYLSVLKPEHVVFSGFPRRVDQVPYLDSIVKDFKQDLKAVILMQVPDAIVLDRVAGRLYSPASHRFYHQRYDPPKQAWIDDETGQPLIRRGDDDPTSVAEKLAVHKREVQPLIEEFSRRGILHKIEATGGIPHVAGIIHRIVAPYFGE